MPNRRAQRGNPRLAMTPTCESLEPRRLLSSGVSPKVVHVAKHADLLAPPIAEVTTSQSILTKSAGQAFQQFSSDLENLEKSSHVTPGEYNALEYYAGQLDKGIEGANIGGTQMQRQLVELQDVIDTAFVGGGFTASDWSALQKQMSNALSGISATSPLIPQTLSGAVPLSSTSSQLVRDTFTQMRVVGREAHVTLAEHATFVADEKAVYAAIGGAVDTNVGASTPRNPLQVYYDGQVSGFVHNKT
jgi:hypothetical protein